MRCKFIYTDTDLNGYVNPNKPIHCKICKTSYKTKERVIIVGTLIEGPDSGLNERRLFEYLLGRIIDDPLKELFLQHKPLHRCFICDKGFAAGVNPENLKSIPNDLNSFGDENVKLLPYHDVIKHLRLVLKIYFNRSAD